MGIKIDGRALAKLHEEQLRTKLSGLQISGLRQPVVVSFCNTDDPPSVQYTEMKQRKAMEVGIDFRAEPYSTQTSREILTESIERYNSDPDIDGIMVQLPLPKKLNVIKDDLLNLISPKKDVDGLTGNGQFLSATAKGVMSILGSIGVDYNRVYSVVGSQGQVGREIVKVLQTGEASVIEIDQKNPETNLSDIQRSNIVISCVGKSGLILPEHIKDGSVLIDVGLGDVGNSMGDFDPACFVKASMYTPKIGGVGPMTVISLMENAVDAWKKSLGLATLH